MTKPGTKFWLILGALAIIIGCAIATSKLNGFYNSEAHLTAATDSDKPKVEAPDFYVYDTEGNKVSLSSLRDGRKAVLTFWVSWEEDCIVGLESCEAAYREFGEDVLFMMVDLPNDGRETEDMAKSLIASKGWTFPVSFDTDNEVYQYYDVTGVPSTYVLNSDGTFYGFTQGSLETDALIDAINNAD